MKKRPVCDLSELYSNPEMIAGCRLNAALDPTDPAYTIWVMRTITPPPPHNDVEMDKSGVDALTAKVATDAVNTLIVLAAIDQQLADTVAAKLEGFLGFPMNVTVTIAEKEEEPS